MVKRNEKLIMLTIVVCFIAAFVVNILAAIIYPPDFNGIVPIYTADWVMVVQAAGAFLLVAMTVIAMKAEEERQILAAAGFTAQAISFGISVVCLFDIADVQTFEEYEDYYRVTVSSNFLLIPSMVLIASYDRFWMWVRYMSLVSMVPFLIASVAFLGGVRDYHFLETFVNIGVILFSLCWVIWAVNIYMNFKKSEKQG
jgi:hypothetical protein